jgi:hypothetical protein
MMKPLKRPSSGQIVRKDNPSDYTGDGASERVLLVNLFFIRFGTKDRVQGAAIMLSILLLLCISLVAILGYFSNNPLKDPWFEKIFSWLGSTFVFVSGVAVGRAGVSAPDRD